MSVINSTIVRIMATLGPALWAVESLRLRPGMIQAETLLREIER